MRRIRPIVVRFLVFAVVVSNGFGTDLHAQAAGEEALLLTAYLTRTFDLTSSSPQYSSPILIDDCAKAELFFSSHSNSLDISITDPLGHSYRVGDPPAAGFTSTSYLLGDPANLPTTMHVVVFTNPAPGIWTYHVAAPSPPPVPIGVLFELRLDSTLRAGLFGGGQTLQLGDSIVVAAVAADPSHVYSDVEISGVLERVDDRSALAVPISFHDDATQGDQTAGDGLYTATVTPTSAGRFRVRAEIEGTNVRGVAFRRENTVSFSVLPVTARLVGSFADRGIDTNGDGLFEFVGIAPAISVSRPGAYVVRVELRANSGLTLTAVSTVNLAAGQAAPEVTFGAQSIIGELQAEGPYTVASVRLDYIEPDDHAHLDTLEELGPTSPYTFGQLQHGAIEIDTYGNERILDSDGDGKTDWLEITLAANFMFSGRYGWTAHLVDPQRNEITIATNEETFAAGANILTLAFDGTAIGANGFDGPYVVRNLVVYGTEPGSNRAVRVDQAFVTEPYLAESFEGYEPCGFAPTTDIYHILGPGECALVLNYPPPRLAQHCQAASVVFDPPPGSTFPVGTTTVTAEARDADSTLLATTSFTVTVIDPIDPDIVCAENTTVPATDATGASVAYSVAATDNCGTPVVACQPASGSTFPVGTTVVTCTATDGGANETSCSFYVHVTCTTVPGIPTISGTPMVCPNGEGTYVASAPGATRYTWTVPAGAVIRGGQGSDRLFVRFGEQPGPVTVTASNTCGSGPEASFEPESGTELTIDTEVLPNVRPGEHFSVTLAASGGVAPYTFEGTSGEQLPSGLTLELDGTLEGAVIAPGEFPLRFRVMDSTGCVGYRSFVLHVSDCPTLTIAPFQMPIGSVGETYPPTWLGAAGGAAPYVLSAMLPPGLSMTNGTISGIPLTPGRHEVGVWITDANGCRGFASYSLTVRCPVLTIAPETLAHGRLGTSYSQAVTGAGGSGPYTVAFAGTLPAGLQYYNSLIVGTPTEVGAFSVRAVVTDATGCSGFKDYTLVVDSCDALTVYPPSLPGATAGNAYYSGEFSATGGASPYRFQLFGALPSGLTFTGQAITGTPSQLGSFPITVRGTDEQGCTGDRQYTVVVGTCPELSIEPSVMPIATNGVPIAPIAFAAAGGNAPYTYSLVGTLPLGLTFTGSTISGNPAQSGSFPLTVRATDSNGCPISRAVTLLVNSRPVARSRHIAVTAGTDCSAEASIDDGSFDPDGNPITMSQTPASPYPLGVTTVTLVATDSYGATSQSVATVTVREQNPPLYTYVPGDTVARAAPGQPAVSVSYEAPTATGSCLTSGPISVQCNPPSGSQFPVGLSPVSCSATNSSGLTRATAFNVLVKNSGDTLGALIGSNWGLYLANGPLGNPIRQIEFNYARLGTPIAGDWNGDGVDTIGYFSTFTDTLGRLTAKFDLRNANTSGGTNVSITALVPAGTNPVALRPVAGDWNGDGFATVGMYDRSSGTFYLKSANVSGPFDVSFAFGAGGPGTSTLQPIAGDWNGDAVDTVGVHDRVTNTFRLRNANTAGAADVTLVFPSSQPVVTAVAGDWDGDGIDTVGSVGNGNAALRNSNTVGPWDVQFVTATANPEVVAGNWDGDLEPVVTAYAPATVKQGATATVTIAGQNLGTNSGVRFNSHAGLTISNVASTSGQVSFQLSVATNAEVGTRSLWLETPFGPTNSMRYTIRAQNGVGETDTAGLYQSSTGQFYLRNSNSPGAAERSFQFGGANGGTVPLRGDWNGDGTDTVGLYDPGTGNFFLKNTNAAGNADKVFGFGPAGQGAVPVVGDWDANGIDTVGVYLPSTGAFFLRNANSSGAADVVFSFGAGNAGYMPVTGDWNGDQRDTVGLYLPSTGAFFLRDTNSGGNADYVVSFGGGGGRPIAGRWTGGADSVGIFDPATGSFFLRVTLLGESSVIAFTFGAGGGIHEPLVGDWDALGY